MLKKLYYTGHTCIKPKMVLSITRSVNSLQNPNIKFVSNVGNLFVTHMWSTSSLIIYQTNR